jgi:hypothetical protein
VTSALRASRRLPGRFAAPHGRPTSGRILVRVTMELPIPWSSCSNTRPVFGRLGATGVSCPVGS